MSINILRWWKRICPPLGPWRDRYWSVWSAGMLFVVSIKIMPWHGAFLCLGSYVHPSSRCEAYFYHCCLLWSIEEITWGIVARVTIMLICNFVALAVYKCCSLHTSSSDVVVSAPSFVGYQRSPPRRKLLSHSFAQYATYDRNNFMQYIAYTQTLTAHRLSDRKAVRSKQWKCTQHIAQWLQTLSTRKTMVTKIEREGYKSKYPSDVAPVVLVSNETHWYMLLINLIVPIVQHRKCLVACLLSLARQSWRCIFQGRRPTEKWVTP